MEGEGRIGAVRHHHRVAGIDEGADGEAQKIIGADAEADILDPHAMMPRQRLAQHEAFGVAVPVDPPGARVDRGDCLGRGAERALVGADAKLDRMAETALELLGRDERNGRRQRADQTRE